MHVRMCVSMCVCVSDRQRERVRAVGERAIGREVDVWINTKPSGGLLLPEREGTGHPAESGEGGSNRETKREMS